jgi:hypothetical protein
MIKNMHKIRSGTTRAPQIIHFTTVVVEVPPRRIDLIASKYANHMANERGADLAFLAVKVNIDTLVEAFLNNGQDEREEKEQRCCGVRVKIVLYGEHVMTNHFEVCVQAIDVLLDSRYDTDHVDVPLKGAKAANISCGRPALVEACLALARLRPGGAGGEQQRQSLDDCATLEGS